MRCSGTFFSLFTSFPCSFPNGTPSPQRICSLTVSATLGSAFGWRSVSQSAASCCSATVGGRSAHCLWEAMRMPCVLLANTSKPWNRLVQRPSSQPNPSKRHAHGPSFVAMGMEWTRSDDDVFVRLDPGEEIHASLQGLADELGFDAAAITSGIGRTRDSTYGYMDDKHRYHRVTVEGSSELVTLQGNLARRETGEAFTHLHAT